MKKGLTKKGFEISGFNLVILIIIGIAFILLIWILKSIMCRIGVLEWPC